MKCTSCGKRPASVHYTEVTGEQSSEFHICQECAEAKGIIQGKGPMLKFSIGEFLAGMAETGEGEADPAGGVACESCGNTYGQFRETGRLGCARCYATFAVQLRPLLRRIHGSTDHVGKKPRGVRPDGRSDAEVARLREELRRALEREDFERCAEIRDRIRAAQEGSAGS